MHRHHIDSNVYISSGHAKCVLSVRSLGMEGVEAPAEGSEDVVSEALACEVFCAFSFWWEN